MLNSTYNDNACRGDTSISCVIKEYRVKDYELPKGNGLNGYGVEIYMKPPTSSGLTMNKAYKTILTEYYLLDAYALVGTIGGTLGLMIGFSFMGFITSITEFVMSMKTIHQKSNQNLQRAKKSKVKRKTANRGI